MLDATAIALGLGQLAPEQLRTTLESYLPKNATSAEKVRAIEAGLQCPPGQSMREAMARWIVDGIVPVEKLVPESYLKWRPPVRDSMIFVVRRLSASRLAPKLVEQLELPANTPPEVRLLRLIAKVPGLQKLGQVIARNRHLHPALRKALTKLEDGIRDVSPEGIRAIITEQLGSKTKTFDVRVSSKILKEASVSAVVRFTWRDPDTGRRQSGVFKVLKPHIPEYFAEDMDYLQGLARYFGDRHHSYGFPAHLIPDTFKKVRRLLSHEVNFRREQTTLLAVDALYTSHPEVRIPQVIRPLCTSRITALSEERGVKITNAAARLPISVRKKVAEQLVEALIAVPLLSASEDAVFHGDPHAGNLLYDNRTRMLVILDWALQERLGRDARRHLALLFLMVSMRDPVGTYNEIVALREIHGRHPNKISKLRERKIQDSVATFLDAMPASQLLSVADSMRLLEQVAMLGVRFPGALVMLSKLMLTLEGVLGDIVGRDTSIGFSVARQVALHWLAHRDEFRLPITKSDWITLQCSALLLPSRLGIQWQKTMLNRWLKADSASSSAR